MLQTIRHLLSLIRFSHTLFALPFALLAAMMAWTEVRRGEGEEGFSWETLLGILLCMLFARSAAMAFNRLVDRKIDAGNPRTEGRHLPAGILSVGQVAAFTIFSSLGFVASTLLFLPNRLPLYLSLPVLVWLCGYSFAKRFTSLSHFWLGVALGLSPVAAWIAIRGEEVLARPLDLLPAMILAAAVTAWVAGFDILYACQDYEYDCKEKLHSVPTALGIGGALHLAALCHAIAVLFFALLPLVYSPLGVVYWGGVAFVAGLLLYEHALVRPDDLSRINIAFFNINIMIGLGLLIVGTLDLIL